MPKSNGFSGHPSQGEYPHVTLADLDEAKIKHFVGLSKLSWDTPENVLEKLALFKGHVNRRV